MGDAFSSDCPPPLAPPPGAVELGTGWRVAVEMWRAHAPVVVDLADAVGVCRVCRIAAPCDMWAWLNRFLGAAAGVPVGGRSESLPGLPEFPDTAGLRLRGAAVGRAVVPPVPVEARRRLDRRRLDLPAASSDGRRERGWLG